MVALRSLSVETERELAQTLAHHGQLTRHIVALRMAGEPADSSFLRKLGWQLDACANWIARYRRELDFDETQGASPGQAASAAPGVTDAEAPRSGATGQAWPGLAAERNADAPGSIAKDAA